MHWQIFQLRVPVAAVAIERGAAFIKPISLLGEAMNEQDLMAFVDDDEAAPAIAGPAAKPWRVLVVDDDEDVHESTAFGVRGMEIEGRHLQVLHAYSGVEALALLSRESDIAVILLDVVMETEAQAEVLREFGCDEVQGYLYGRPMPLDGLSAWLGTRGAV